MRIIQNKEEVVLSFKPKRIRPLFLHKELKRTNGLMSNSYE
tara:strand:- start:297 stop:419 length:123 start_codon:yes stop_codon:yes gene_type:complete